jgi:hypothetical protein
MVTVITCIALRLIASILFDKTVGRLAMVVFILLPVTFDFATQARSSALVTCIVACLILRIVLLNELSSKRFNLSVNVLFATQILMNILSVFSLGLYLYLEKLLRPESKTKSNFVRRYFFPLVLMAPLAIIAKGQEEQIAWIANQYSPLKQLARIFLWPFIESDREVSLISIAIIPLSAFLALNLLSHRAESKREKRLILWIICFFLLPSFFVWVVSLYQPLFIARYFAYSSIGFAILFALVIKSRSNRWLTLVLVLAMSFLCVVNTSTILSKRGSEFNWKAKHEIISQKHFDATLVSSPEWYWPMLSYYSGQGKGIKRLSQLEQTFRTYKKENACLILPMKVWLIPIAREVEQRDVQVLEGIGYKSVKSSFSFDTGVELYELSGCRN